MKENSEEEKARLPPGQHITDRFPVLQKGNIPHIIIPQITFMLSSYYSI